MSAITLGGSGFGPQSCSMVIEEISGEQVMMDGSLRKDKYGLKRSWDIGWEFINQTDLDSLITLYEAGGTIPFTDVFDDTYTVMFSGDLKITIDPIFFSTTTSLRRYKANITLREA